MDGRTVLIHGEARKNKSYRKKYFVLNIGPNYASPRLDYFSSIDKWNLHKDEIHDDIPDCLSFRSIDLSNLFFVDDTHRSKPRHGGLDLYMEDRHVFLILSSDESRKKWKEAFENIIYKNGKIKSYPKIEHTLQVSLRLKPKDNIDKAILLQWKGDFRACFMKTSLIFFNKSLESPNFIIQYPFIRQWESRFNGTFRLEIGRAALIGECSLILQLFDYSESKAAHSMLTDCIKFFKISRPDPPRIRSAGDRNSDRNSSISYGRRSSLGRNNSTYGALRSDSCMGFSRDSYSLIGSQIEAADALLEQEDNNYLPMKMPADDRKKSLDVQNYIEHISRIYKCPSCGFFTKVVTFCSNCTNTSSLNGLRMLSKTEPLPNTLKTKLLPSIRGKAQSLTERPRQKSSSVHLNKQKSLFSDPSKSTLSQISQSSESKTSTNEMSSSSKLQSQNSLSISANRHDDEIFMELDFDNLEPQSTSTSNFSNKYFDQSQLKCGKCSASLVNKSPTDLFAEHRCSKCSDGLVSLTMVVEESDCFYNDWIPRTTSLVPAFRLATVTTCNSEYVEVNHNEISRDTHHLNDLCL